MNFVGFSMIYCLQEIKNVVLEMHERGGRYGEVRPKSCIILVSSCCSRLQAATLLLTYSQTVVCSGPSPRETDVDFGRAGADVCCLE